MNINKPSNMTSHDVVFRIRKLIKQKRIGHAGTLDPQATGVLVLLLGKATKLAETLKGDSKEYFASMKLGIRTTTQDAWGEITEQKTDFSLQKEAVENALLSFKGETNQIPPMFSALHHKGKRLYELARQGKEVERLPRQIKIFEIELLNFRPSDNLTFRVVCSGGTYIRTLCADVGEALGVGGHLTSLKRMRSGKFKIEDAIDLSDLIKGKIKVEEVLLSITRQTS
ncbi:MAG: tRNA pseudouridine(55) synthase TruB [bacterium]|nr:tRNA pseudouridine(55) synthase TruB [bacterium]